MIVTIRLISITIPLRLAAACVLPSFLIVKPVQLQVLPPLALFAQDFITGTVGLPPVILAHPLARPAPVLLYARAVPIT